MDFSSTNALLSQVLNPSRYLGSETNSVFKDPGSVKLRMALAFPDVYEIGTSHFGLQILYSILNGEPEVYAERVFAPGIDMAEKLKASKQPLFSLETRTPLNDFDVVGFSLLYELNYTNILLMLDLAGIPFFAAERDCKHPVIIAGGPCTVNPEPVAPFFDAMVIGDGENALLEMSKVFLEWKKIANGRKEELLEAWSRIEGVYIPSFFTTANDGTGGQKLTPLRSGYERVVRAVVPDLDRAPFPAAPVVSFGRPVHDRLRLEIARGCTRGCRFCQAGMIYRPVRERSPANLLDLTEKSLAATGYDELSLLSLSTGDYSCFSPLLKKLMDQYSSRHLAVSIPSFRAGTLAPEIMDLIRQVRKTGFTIAPEAGSDRLRKVINKNITEEQIEETVSSAFSMGWQLIKLYFMVGLPTESNVDLDAIAELVKRLKKIRGPGSRRGRINVSAATFIPKSHTPLQWAKQIDVETAREKIDYLRSVLKIPGVQFKWQNPETSLLEGLFARGDRRLAHLLVEAYENGCRFDGWTDSFDYPAWKDALSKLSIDPQDYIAGAIDSVLPWDHIDTRISKDFLKDEYVRAIGGTPTPDCRSGDCQGCGACDFETIAPIIAADDKDSSLGYSDTKLSSVLGSSPAADERMKITFSKQGPARFFGHLELVNIMIRALARAGLPVAYSAGFHPKPRIAFEEALPVGMESMSETFYLTLTGQVPAARIIGDLNSQLPGGLRIIDCRIAPPKSADRRPETAAYRVYIESGFDEGSVEAFKSADQFEIRQQTKKGKEKILDLKTLVREIQLIAPQHLWLRLENQTGASIRPTAVIRMVFGLREEQISMAHIIKLPEAVSCESSGKCIM